MQHDRCNRPHPFVSSRLLGELQACNSAAQDKIALLEQTAEEEATAAQQATAELQRAHEEATAAAQAAHQQAQEALQKQLQEAKVRLTLAGLNPHACRTLPNLSSCLACLVPESDQLTYSAIC